MMTDSEKIQKFSELIQLLHMPLKAHYSKPEAARIMGFSQATLNRWIAEGKGPKYKKPQNTLSGKVFYPLHELAFFYFENIQTA